MKDESETPRRKQIKKSDEKSKAEEAAPAEIKETTEPYRIGERRPGESPYFKGRTPPDHPIFKMGWIIGGNYARRPPETPAKPLKPDVKVTFAGSAAKGDLKLQAALERHLQVNHHPPVPLSFVPVCIKAIELANAGKWDTLVSLPKGCSYKWRDEAPVSAIVEQHHLNSFLSSEDDP